MTEHSMPPRDELYPLELLHSPLGETFGLCKADHPIISIVRDDKVIRIWNREGRLDVDVEGFTMSEAAKVFIEAVAQLKVVPVAPIEHGIYPLTILTDRYSGTYSGGCYTAWKHPEDCIPAEIDLDDDICDAFWHKERQAGNYSVGVGATVAEAIQDLHNKLPR